MLRFKAIVLLAVFLFSNIGTATVVHYCEGELTGFSLLGVVECNSDHAEIHDCCKSDEFTPSEHLDCKHSDHSEHLKTDHSDCCQTAILDSSSAVIILDDFSTVYAISAIFILANFSLFNQTFIANKADYPDQIFVLPLSKSRQILFQSFLI